LGLGASPDAICHEKKKKGEIKYENKKIKNKKHFGQRRTLHFIHGWMDVILGTGITQQQQQQQLVLE
jgi:hypothetical protein